MRNAVLMIVASAAILFSGCWGEDRTEVKASADLPGYFEATNSAYANRTLRSMALVPGTGQGPDLIRNVTFGPRAVGPEDFAFTYLAYRFAGENGEFSFDRGPAFELSEFKNATRLTAKFPPATQNDEVRRHVRTFLERVSDYDAKERDALANETVASRQAAYDNCCGDQFAVFFSHDRMHLQELFDELRPTRDPRYWFETFEARTPGGRFKGELGWDFFFQLTVFRSEGDSYGNQVVVTAADRVFVEAVLNETGLSKERQWQLVEDSVAAHGLTPLDRARTHMQSHVGGS